MKRLPVLLLSVLLVAAGCSAPVPEAGLAGRTFVSQQVSEDGIPRPLAPNTQIRLTFDAAGNLGASAGCNSIGGTWRLDGDVLRVEPGAMTEMACDPPRDEQDRWLIELLGSGPRVTLVGNDLTLQAGATIVRLLDRAVAEPDRPLVGTAWTLESIRTGDAVSSIANGPIATLQIAEDGTAVVSTGCNEGGARVSVEGDRVRFLDVVTTRRACLDAGADVERAVLEVLRSETLRWSIDADRLTLDAGEVGLDLRAG